MHGLKKASLIAAVIGLATSAAAISKPPKDRGGGGKGGEEPSGPFDPAYVHSLSGRTPTLVIANRDFSRSATAAALSDARARGLDHAPDAGRTLTEEHRALWETEYSMDADGAISVASRVLLHDGENSAAKVQCIATAANGVRAYSLISATGGELKVRTAGGQSITHHNVGALESCDFFSDGTTLAAIENLPGSAGHELVTIDTLTGARTSLLLVPNDSLDLNEIDVARDGQSYLLSWSDRRSSTSVPKISEWSPGQTFDGSSALAEHADGATYTCDFNANGLADDGYIYRSTAGRSPVWIEQSSGGSNELIASKGKEDIYNLKPAC